MKSQNLLLKEGLEPVPENLTYKIGDTIERMGNTIGHSGLKKVGDVIEKVGDTIEHLGDRRISRRGRRLTILAGTVALGFFVARFFFAKKSSPLKKSFRG